MAKEVLILVVGRLRDPLLEAACADYFKRCRRRLEARVREMTSLERLKGALPAGATVVALDERGKAESSARFAERMDGWLQIPSKTLTFVIGGADGLDDALRARADHLLSLGPMTLAHRLARLVLAEQIYRAVSILEGSPYHRA